MCKEDMSQEEIDAIEAEDAAEQAESERRAEARNDEVMVNGRWRPADDDPRGY